jgi:hypothetical protein
MARLYASVTVLIIVFSTALGFFAAAAWDSWWVWAVVGAGVLLVFLALGGRLVPSARRSLAPRDASSGSALMQAFGAFCTLEVLILGLVLWVWGNRTHMANNAYQVLGLLIFLALIGIGAPGAIVTFVRFLYVRNMVHQEDRRTAAAAGVH